MFKKCIRDHLKLCYVTHRAESSDDWLLYTAKQAVQGGVSMVQLREKNTPVSEIVRLAAMLKTMLMPYKVPLIINDYIEVCKVVGADGVHVGQGDIHPDEARKILGNEAIIGLSVENMQQAEQANKLNSIDYIAASPVFSTTTKSDCNQAWGLVHLKQLTGISRYPVVGIGGINSSNVLEVIKAGACGVAVVSSIQFATNIQEATAFLRNNVDRSSL